MRDIEGYCWDAVGTECNSPDFSLFLYHKTLFHGCLSERCRKRCRCVRFLARYPWTKIKNFCMLAGPSILEIFIFNICPVSIKEVLLAEDTFLFIILIFIFSICTCLDLSLHWHPLLSACSWSVMSVYVCTHQGVHTPWRPLTYPILLLHSPTQCRTRNAWRCSLGHQDLIGDPGLHAGSPAAWAHPAVKWGTGRTRLVMRTGIWLRITSGKSLL